MMISTRVLKAEAPGAIQAALAVLRRGGLVAFPTDTVYGVGAQTFDSTAVERIYIAKGRIAAKALPILLADVESVSSVAEILPVGARRLANAFWPGPLTLVVRKLASVPDAVSQGNTIGLRVPDHAVALGLLRASGPLAVTSANPSGGPNPLSAEEVVLGLGGKIDLVLDGGKTPGGRPSTVVDCTVEPPVLVREGPVSLAAILEVLGAGAG
jgi:L-threonylcarbamoyladenylate synthase